MSINESPTKFAPAQRSSVANVRVQSTKVLASPNVAVFLESFPMSAMILNEERQIVAANQNFMDLLGRSAQALVGLRVGEAFDCIYSKDEAGGCGTSIFCRTCGAVKAVLGCWTDRVKKVEECRLSSSEPDGTWRAWDLRVFAKPFWIDGEQFTIVSLTDITDEKRRMVLERLFFHDVLNSAGGIHGLLDALPAPADEEGAQILGLLRSETGDLLEQITAGRDLGAAERGELVVKPARLKVRQFLTDICSMYRHHVVSSGKTITPACDPEEATVVADELILRRIIGNLLKNALEASVPGQNVTVGFHKNIGPTFSVHNESAMPEYVRLQIFQRSFSTKRGSGRGIGTYSVKILTENYLKGSITLVSNAESGTTFTLTLPDHSI
ncbi:MAG TPA: ATP-binding protein [Candidatus Angelobacter sp.]|nr:ATP-binding protein [Candidatus Angelobacter sp.]